ncbi:MAG: TetR/AcrR family transcriptional regulator [Actinocatenispora sp.]
MTRHDSSDEARRGLPDKRRAILRGALAVFSRDGYTRASMATIATEAGVSTRTIYNHFDDKAQLFQTVIEDSATQVADAQIAIVDRHLRRVTDLEADLTEFGCAWATPTSDFADHFALVRQINAEVGHVPQEAVDSWQQVGPLRVRREIARHLQTLADRGLLHIDDADRAATHFVLLAASEVTSRTYHGAVPMPTDEIAEIATAGVRAFLRGYLP